ncbi:hypothetical protein E4T50_17108 [Aureobasidium sp. EXF-12298]|jgi:hypothetical protein|nr:hypothetical protein E4T50_17108 [Aureobasidium sp. EXF-12298]KAI4749985.1 hypothetical protein E4T51_16640 [Aureobasidium sp. EXF-12344]KAI4767417.1 hypothetical protein E4T52_17399 [Aureobasidium sp. EXF-3400]
MDRPNSKPMPPGGSGVAAAIRVVPSRKARHYRDHDYVLAGPRPLDYDELDLNTSDPKPSISRHKRTVSQHKRHNSQDGYHLVIHGSDHSSRRLTTSTASPFNTRETLEQARRGKRPELQELPSNRKRSADAEETRQHSFKKQRKSKDDRSDRLCLQCGNYHISPCFVPLCSACGLKHYGQISCLDAVEKLKQRLELHAPPEIPLSSKQVDKKMAPKSLPLHFRVESHVPAAPSSDLRAPTLGSASESSTDHQKKESPGKRTCPLCRDCGSFHRSPCKWLVCETCKVKHHPETPCAMAEARLKTRLEEDDARQAQVAEEIKQRAQDIIEMNEKMASTGLRFRRSSAPSPGRAFSPEVAPKKTKMLKKNTRFCRDCGRYLNGPCTWPTCGKCGIKHFGNVSCLKAQQTLQHRLDTFDRGYGTSQQKKIKTSPEPSQPSSMPVEPLSNSNHVVPAAPVSVAAPVNMTFNIPANGQMSWSLDSNKTVHFGLPPSMPGFSVSTSSTPPQTNNHVHPSRQALLLEQSERAASSPQPKADVPSTGSVIPLSNSRNEPSQAITHGVSVEQNVDAFIADVFQAMHGNGQVIMRYTTGPQGTPSYLEYLRRNSSS